MVRSLHKSYSIMKVKKLNIVYFRNVSSSLYNSHCLENAFSSKIPIYQSRSKQINSGMAQLWLYRGRGCRWCACEAHPIGGLGACSPRKNVQILDLR